MAEQNKTRNGCSFSEHHLYWALNGAGLLAKKAVHDQILVAWASLIKFFLNSECWIDLGYLLV